MEKVGWRGARRLAGYTLATIVPVVWLGLLLEHTLADEADKAALREGGAQAATIAAAAVEPQLSGRTLTQGLTIGERTSLQMAVASLVADGTILQLRVHAPDGSVVFDSLDPAAVQQVGQFATGDVAAALGGEHVIARTTVGEPAVESVESVVAIHRSTDGRVFGAVEVAVPLAPLEQEQHDSLSRLRTALVVGLVTLWLVLATIVWGVGRRLRATSQRNEFLALHDPLTGLPNRVLYADRVASALAASGRAGTDVALVVLDLDRFKEVNDTLGHRNGDEFLRIVAHRLTTVLRPGDTVARLGGDEFGIVLPGVGAETVELILRRLQDTVGQEAELGGVAVTAECSLGYAMWPSDADHADALVQRADLALYAAKAARASIVRYHAGIDEFDPQRLGLVAELRRAISGGDLVLHYQPKVDAVTREVVGFEALVRWRHPVRGLIPPADFIPIAESTGLIGPLTQWVVDTALAQLSAWHRSQPQLVMAVNISARNLRDDLPGWILNRLAAHRVKAHRLVLEITETSFATDPARATLLIEELSAAGVVVSLDDFGQGYTSLGSLGHLPVSELKIDRGFVVAMQNNPEDRAIVASVIELGHHLGLRVVAEGVENEAVCALLRDLGCDTMQGYLFSPPVPAEEALSLIDTIPVPA